jgi:hypothetical protein
VFDAPDPRHVEVVILVGDLAFVGLQVTTRLVGTRTAVEELILGPQGDVVQPEPAEPVVHGAKCFSVRGRKL